MLVLKHSLDILSLAEPRAGLLRCAVYCLLLAVSNCRLLWPKARNVMENDLPHNTIAGHFLNFICMEEGNIIIFLYACILKRSVTRSSVKMIIGFLNPFFNVMCGVCFYCKLGLGSSTHVYLVGLLFPWYRKKCFAY